MNITESRLEREINRLADQLDNEMDAGNHDKAAVLALEIFALFQGQMGCDRGMQKRLVASLMKDTTEDNVATHNVKWKRNLGVAAGVIQIAAGIFGVAGVTGGALIPQEAIAALFKGIGSSAQTFSYAGNGADSIGNALFSSTEGKRVELNSREQIQREERDELKNGIDSAKQSKNQTWEQIKEKIKAFQNMVSQILRGN